MTYSFTEKTYSKTIWHPAKCYVFAISVKNPNRFIPNFCKKVKTQQIETIQALKVFKSIFPINSASGNAALDYISYELGECLYTPQECKMKGISYAVPLYANLQLRMMDKATGYKTIKENGIKEDRVFLGEIPVMTKDGSFVVNGTERVVVSQLHDLQVYSLTMIKARHMLLVKFYMLQGSFLTEAHSLIMNLMLKI